RYFRSGTNYISYKQIEEGGLNKGEYKILLLPLSQAISLKEAEEIRKFVKEGGLVIADVRAGVMDEHCKPIPVGLLDDVFGIKRKGSALSAEKSQILFTDNYKTVAQTGNKLNSKMFEPGIGLTSGLALAKEKNQGIPTMVINEYGKGKAVYFNALLLNEYEFYRSHSKLAAMRKRTKKPETLFRQILKLAGVENKVKIATMDGQPLSLCETVRFSMGRNNYLGILRDYPATKENDEETKKIKISLPEKYYVYDVRNKKYYGFTDEIETNIAFDEAKFYALLPYQIKDVKLEISSLARKGERIPYRIKINSSKRKVGNHVVRFEVFDPEGKECLYYSKNLLVKNGSLSGEIPFSLNEKSGNWKIKVTDVISGKGKEKTFKML
ncbi:MAG: beta-galactosidase trimerization domain-containing protein, partial [Victivallaceae bacterium]|nr:beta-galactosidase trimerization domain-containing protein [Victivallaceae bacterium]